MLGIMWGKKTRKSSVLASRLRARTTNHDDSADRTIVPSAVTTPSSTVFHTVGHSVAELKAFAKKIEGKEVKMAMLAVIATAASILVFTAISSVVQFDKNSYWNSPGPATANVSNGGPHGFDEILYTFTSGTGNNGSAFGGINTNTPWYNLTIGLAMLIGRFMFLLPLLAVAGSLAAKKKVATTSGTFPTHGALFVGLLIGTVVIVGALTFFPALSLGPVVEHYLMHQGKLF